MEKYGIAILAVFSGALVILLLVLGFFFHRTSAELADLQSKYELVEAVNEANKKAIARLDKNIESTDRIMSGWNENRTTLSALRDEMRRAVKEAMKDEVYKAWASTMAPDSAWRMLREASDKIRNNSAGTAKGAAAKLPGAGDPGKRN
jgi:glycyl-tRNA synthetase beta subunit